MDMAKTIVGSNFLIKNLRIRTAPSGRGYQAPQTQGNQQQINYVQSQQYQPKHQYSQQRQRPSYGAQGNQQPNDNQYTQDDLKKAIQVMRLVTEGNDTTATLSRIERNQCDYCSEEGHTDDNCPTAELKCCQLIQGDLMAIKSAFCKTKGKPVFQVKIKQKNKVSKEAKVMIDSGSDYSCFSEQWCRDHKIDIYKPKEHLPQFAGAGGASMKLVGMAKFHIIIGGRFYEIEPIVVANHMKQPLVGQEFCSNHNLMCGALNQKWFIKDVATSITIAEKKDVFHNINMILTQHANQKYINRIDLSQFTEVEPMVFEEISVQDQIMEAKLEWMRIENMTEEELNTLKLEDIIKEATITFEGSGTGDRIEVEPTGRVNLIADETCQQAEEIFTEEWKKMWAEKFADKNQPKIQCKPINIKGKDGVTLHGQKAHRMTKNSEKMARAKIDEMVKKKNLRPINNSPLGIPIIMVPKPGMKKMRMVVDMRLYNALTEKSQLTITQH